MALTHQSSYPVCRPIKNKTNNKLIIKTTTYDIRENFHLAVACNWCSFNSASSFSSSLSTFHPHPYEGGGGRKEGEGKEVQQRIKLLRTHTHSPNLESIDRSVQGAGGGKRNPKRVQEKRGEREKERKKRGEKKEGIKEMHRLNTLASTQDQDLQSFRCFSGSDVLFYCYYFNRRCDERHPIRNYLHLFAFWQKIK